MTHQLFSNFFSKDINFTRFFSFLGILFRIFIGSLLFAVTPYWTFGIVLLLYSVNLIVFKATGHNWTCVLYSYTSLVFPSGYTKLLGDAPNRNFQHVVSLQRSGHSTTEVKRVRLNQEQLLKQCRISFGLFSLFNLMCLIVYIGKRILLLYCTVWKYSRFFHHLDFMWNQFWGF